MNVALTVAITGCAGFIGSKTAQLLLDDGVNVIGIDCFSRDLYPAEPKRDSLAALLKYPHFTFHEIDLRNGDLAVAIAPADAVIHFAALAGLAPSWSNPDLYRSHNVDATRRLVEAMIDSGTAHLVHASTSSVYGREAVGNEELELRPVSPYGETKLAAEAIVQAATESGELSATILRYFSVYGPGQRPDMAYAKAIQAIRDDQEMCITGDGSQRRSNTFIDDAARAAILSVGKQPSATFNICGDESIALIDAIRHIERLIGKPARLTFTPRARGDQTVTHGDSTKASQLLGWRPTTDIFDGLAQQIDSMIPTLARQRS